MDSRNVKEHGVSRQESPADRQLHMAEEAALIAEADAEIEAGLYVESAELTRWIDRIGTGREIPQPSARRR